MGRKLTPEEEREFEERRWQEYVERAKQHGATPEKLKEEYEQRRQIALRECWKDVIIEGEMNDDEFSLFVEEQCRRFSEEETRATFRKVAEKNRLTYSDTIISFKEYLSLTANAMLRSEQYQKKKTTSK